MSALLQLGNPITSWGLRVEFLQLSLDISGKLCLCSSCISSSSSVHISGRICHSTIQTFDSGEPCWMEAPWLAAVLNMLEDIPECSPIIRGLIVDVLVGQVLKGLLSAFLTLWLLGDICCTDKGSVPWSVRQWWGQLKQLQ